MEKSAGGLVGVAHADEDARGDGERAEARSGTPNRARTAPGRLSRRAHRVATCDQAADSRIQGI
jgi:hypothetical protein